VSFFCFGNSPSPRAIWGSRHLCDESVYFASRQRGLCRPSGADWAVPRVPSRHRLCREYLGLCRVELALGIAPDSGSGEPESEREREWCMAWHVTCTLHSCNHIAAPDKHESKMQAILGLCEVKL
jgi:hypothetical protein